MATFENPEMKVIKPGEEAPIKLTKLTHEGLGLKLEDFIAEKLDAHERGEHILSCTEIHDLASSYAEISKTGAPFDWCRCSCGTPDDYEENKNARTHE